MDLLLALRGSSAHVRRSAPRLATAVSRLLCAAVPGTGVHAAALVRLATTDLLEEAMRRRQGELRSAAISSAAGPRVVLAEDIAQRPWRLDDECWLVDDPLHEASSRASACPAASPAVALCFDCRSATVLGVDADGRALLDRLRTGAPVFDAEHPYTRDGMERAAAWIRRGVLVPADVLRERGDA